MSTPKTAKMPTAVTKYSDLDLSCQHLTTSNFMEFNLAYRRELVPNQSIDIDMTTFVRMDALPVPTFGNCDIHNRAYFVPYRTVMRGWNDFINDTTYVDFQGNVISPHVPLIDNEQFIKLFEGNFGFADIVVEPDDEDNIPDFIIYPSQGVVNAYRFTPLGKYTYKLLRSLGIGISFDKRSSIYHAALPLLSLMKVYYDWFFPTCYVDDNDANILRRWFEYSPTDDPYEFASEFLALDMAAIFRRLYKVAYDSDYFVSAWDNPVAPNSSAYSPISINDPTMDNLETVSTFTSLNNGTPQSVGVITQFAIDALKSVTDYMKRHQISGAKNIDRYLARWGVQLPAEKLNRSMYIGESLSKFVFGDVFSTADTTTSNLGSYAGRGAGRNEKKSLVSFSTDEFGMLFIVSTIVPRTAYYQGADRTTMHLSRLDFYTPEYDNLGVQALATRELYIPTGKLNPLDAVSGIDYDSSVFGFVPRYAEYKVGHDSMTGDFLLPSKNKATKGWSLMRDVSSLYTSNQATTYDSIVHSLDFVDANDSLQYNRIFYVSSPLEDKFKVVHNFVVKSRFPGSRLYDSYEFKDQDKANKVNIDVNGVRAN